MDPLILKSPNIADVETSWVSEPGQFDGPRCTEECLALIDQLDGCDVRDSAFAVDHDPCPGVIAQIRRKACRLGLKIESAEALGGYKDLLLQEFGRPDEYWPEVTERFHNANRRDRDHDR